MWATTRTVNIEDSGPQQRKTPWPCRALNVVTAGNQGSKSQNSQAQTCSEIQVRRTGKTNSGIWGSNAGRRPDEHEHGYMDPTCPGGRGPGRQMAGKTTHICGAPALDPKIRGGRWDTNNINVTQWPPQQQPQMLGTQHSGEHPQRQRRGAQSLAAHVREEQC